MYISSVVWQDIGAASQIECSHVTKKSLIQQVQCILFCLCILHCVIKTDPGPERGNNQFIGKHPNPRREIWKPADSIALLGPYELNCTVRSLKRCFVFCLWFLLRCIGCVEFEKDNVSILHNVVPALLSVFSCSLKQTTQLENVLRYSNSFVKGIGKVNGMNTGVRMNIKHTPWLRFHCLPL